MRLSYISWVCPFLPATVSKPLSLCLNKAFTNHHHPLGPGIRIAYNISCVFGEDDSNTSRTGDQYWRPPVQSTGDQSTSARASSSCQYPWSIPAAISSTKSISPTPPLNSKGDQYHISMYIIYMHVYIIYIIYYIIFKLPLVC